MPLNFKKKRAAMCFHGQLRQVKTTYEQYIKPNVIDINKDRWDIDIFVHTWWDANDVGKGYKVWGRKNVATTTPVTEDVMDVVFKAYNPKKVLIERQIDFSHITDQYHPHAISIIAPVATQSRHYSMKQCGILKRKYEEENNFKYDLVANMRFDQGIQVPIDFSSFPKGCYNTSPQAWTPTNNVVDSINGYMDSDIYDHMSELYDHMDGYWRNEGVEFLCEHLLVHHLNKKNIPINRIEHLTHFVLVR